VIVTSARFAQRHLVPAPVKTGFARAIKDCGQQAFADLRQNRPDVQFALHARGEILNFFLAMRILQIIKSSAIRERRGERRELQNSLLFAVSARSEEHTSELQ